MTKQTIAHTDKIGQSIEVGSVVAYPISGTLLGVGVVEKLHNIMITVKDTTTHSWRSEVKRYPAQVVVIHSIPETLMYLLTKK